MNRDAVIKAYKRYSSIYNFAFKACFQPGRKSVIKMIAKELPDPRSRLLEVGVGTGLSLPLYQNKYDIIGIDISTAMLQKAKKLVHSKNLSNIKALLEMDAEALKFEDNYFDAVIAMYVASVVPNPEQFISEITRVCKPGGKIFLVNHFSSKNKIINILEKQIAKAPALVGFKADFPIETILKNEHLSLIEQKRTNMFGYWKILHFEKPLI